MGEIFTSLEDPGFNGLFQDFRYTCYRLETLQRYDVSYERDEYSRFLAGESQGESAGIAQWADGTVRRAAEAGRRMQRVHVVEEPLSDYVRYEFGWAYRHTAAAGEDIRVIPVKAGQWPGDVPRYEYWLFDSSLLVWMHYDGEGAFNAAEVVDDPARIVQACYWRDAAVAQSVPFGEYCG